MNLSQFVILYRKQMKARKDIINDKHNRKAKNKKKEELTIILDIKMKMRIN